MWEVFTLTVRTFNFFIFNFILIHYEDPLVALSALGVLVVSEKIVGLVTSAVLG